MVDVKLIGSRLTLLCLATSFFVAAWSGDRPPQYSATAASPVSRFEQPHPDQHAWPDAADRRAVVGLTLPRVGVRPDGEVGLLPSDLTPGLYLIASSEGDSHILEVTADELLQLGHQFELPPRDLYILSTGESRRYFIRIESRPLWGGVADATEAGELR